MAEIIGRVGWRNFVPTENPLWDNLKAYFTGDNTANDSKGVNNGTLINGATYAAGKISNGFSLDGINDYVGFASNWFRKSKTEPFTISSWVNSSVHYGAIFSNGIDDGHLLFIHNQYIYLQMGAGLYGSIRVVSASQIPLNTFKHITITYNGNSTLSGFKIYIDGVSVGVNITQGEYGPLNNLASYDTPAIASIPRIGARCDGALPFAGVLDEVGIWNRVLTATEVTELYSAGSGKQYVAPVVSLITTGLILNLDASNALSYPGTGTVWTDLSGNGNNGTLVNGTSYSSANGSMVFDGINDYVGNVNNYLVSTTQQSFSSNAWVKMSGNPIDSGYNVPSVINFNGNSLNYIQTMSFGLLPNRKLKLRWFDGGQQGKTGNSILNLNTWYYISCSVSNNIIKLYVNGIEEASYTGTDLTNRNGNSDSWTIGNSYYGQFNGDIAQVQVYDKSLSSTEVLQNFNATKSRYGL